MSDIQTSRKLKLLSDDPAVASSGVPKLRDLLQEWGGDVEALEAKLEHFERFKLFLEIMGGIDVDFAWEESAAGEEA